MSTAEDDFTAMWHVEAPRVLAFATRHVGAEAAKDVVAETFLAAWRRYDDMTEPPIGWLLVTARHVIRNRARSQRRHHALQDRIALLDGLAAEVADSADQAITRRDALERLGRLDEVHREALLLVSWDGLTSDQAAQVLGITPAAFRKRLSRARAFITTDPTPADPKPADWPTSPARIHPTEEPSRC